MKKIIVIVLLVTCFNPLFGQQQSQYTQYMYNTMTINPAYTGTRGVASVLGLYRAQWVGLDGAPRTGSFSLDTPISYNGQGLGISVMNDRIGPSSETVVTVNYSYPIQLSNTVKLSLGISAALNFLEVDYSKLRVYDPNDPFLSGTLTKTSPNVGAGAYFHAEKWYFGISVPQFLETKFYDDVQISVASKKMHFYAIGGYVFDLNEEIKFKPAVLVKAVSGSPLAVDVSANFLFNDKFTLGAAYRWDATVSGLVGFQVSPALHIGYAYDYDTEKIGNYNSGSHEVFFRMDLFTRTKYRLVSPRFF